MNYKMKIILSILLFFPLATYAHLISITATTPFPATVPASSTTLATFTVTNIASRVSVTAVNQSHFSQSSGLSIASSTCGALLAPRQTCTIQVSLQASTALQTVTGALKIWAQPSADGVEYPIRVTVSANLPDITLQPINSAGLPALRDPVVAENAGEWLIVSGSTGDFHDFNRDFITSLYVYNPMTSAIYSESVSATNLPATVQNQLISSDPEYLQDGDTLYIIGGFYTPNNVNWVTLNTITAINIPGMINAIKNNVTDLAPFVSYNTTIPQFKVTGGQLGKIDNYFYLAFGQDCEGNYCADSQHYTNSIYQFSTDPTLSSITLINTATHGDLDGSGWRRRDYTLAPFKSNNADTLFALGGPFTPGSEADVWTNGIHIHSDLHTNDNFINQQANQYLAPVLSMYSANKSTTYVATFSGLSNLYWASNGLNYDNTTPYGNILDLISADASGTVQEYANLTPLCSGQPLASCLYMGLAAHFIPIDTYYDSRGILQLDQLPESGPTLVGYVYAGLVSSGQDIFDASPNNATNQVYAVYVTPAGLGPISWRNITNLYPGN